MNNSSRLSLTASLVLALQSLALGGLIDATSWTADSEDGRYQLVMVTDDGPKAIELRKVYPDNGVYETTEVGNRLLWEVSDYFKDTYDVFFSRDGEHVVLAITNSYNSISNLDRPFTRGAGFLCLHSDGTSDYWPEHRVSRGFGLKRLWYDFVTPEAYRWSSATYSAENSTYTVTTSHAEVLAFDIRTGERIASNSALDTCLAIYLLATPGIAFAVCRSHSSGAPTKHTQITVAQLLLIATCVSMLALLGRYSFAFTGLIVVIGALGATTTWLVTRSRLAWCLGTILTPYGVASALTFFAMLVEPLMWAGYWAHAIEWWPLATLIGLLTLGFAFGPVTSARLAKRCCRSVS